MEQREILAGHVKDLWHRTAQNDYLTHTSFLSESELAAVYDELKRMGETQVYLGREARCFPYGGRTGAERNMLVFLPSYLDRESFLAEDLTAGTDGVIALLHVQPKNLRFSEPLTHRDYLGSLMQLGIERDQIGDILVGQKTEEPESQDEAYLYVAAEQAKLLSEELVRVKHTTVTCTIVPLDQCQVQQKFREVTGSVASERLDAILSMVYHLSRGKAQELVDRELVSIDGRLAVSPGYDLKPGQKVSVRGHGKFLYEGPGPLTKKGRMYVKAKVFA